MRKFLFLLMLVFGFITIPRLDAYASKKESVKIKNISDGLTLQKFKSETAYLTVWRDHQKTADIICQPNYPF